MRAFASEAGPRHLVTFTSASAVRAFVDAVGDAAEGVAVASIGPATSAAARQAGLEVLVEADQSTIVGLVEAIIRYVSAERSAQ